MRKEALLILNTYAGTSRDLGDDVIRDGMIMGYHLERVLGYIVYKLINPSVSTAIDNIVKYISMSDAQVVIYYSGHGTRVPDKDGDERVLTTRLEYALESVDPSDTDMKSELERLIQMTKKSYDQAMVFSDGILIDDKLASLLEKHNRTKSLVLINDCCYSGSIWDLHSVSPHHNIISISACTDIQTSKSNHYHSYTPGSKPITTGSGIFTGEFWKHFDIETSTLNITSLNKVIRHSDQTCVITTTSMDIISGVGEYLIPF